MTDYHELIHRLRVEETLPYNVLKEMRSAADAIEALQKELRLCRNELCQHCGEYIRAYDGACNDCRWYAMERWEE